MKEFEYTVQDQLGIHARPAGQIAKLAKAHPDCEISFAKIGGSKTANAARVMALMSLGAKPGDVLHITVEDSSLKSSPERRIRAAFLHFLQKNITLIRKLI